MKTKRTIKRIASTATAAIIAACAMVPLSVSNVSAASIQINNTQTGHTYQAYQIFKGILSNAGTANEKLSDITWGDNINGDAALTDIKAMDTAFKDCANASDVADVLGKYSDDSDMAQKFASTVSKHIKGTPATSTPSGSAYTISVANDGYYLVMDAAGSLADANDKSYTRYIIEVAGTAEMEAKSGLPTLEKQVYDVNDNDDSSVLGKSADSDIGDLVQFELTGVLPSNYTAYKNYSYKIYDTLAEGFTYSDSNSDVSITIGGTDVTDKFIKTLDSNTNIVTFTCDDLKSAGTFANGAAVKVTYKATLDTDAKIGPEGNKNTAYLEYSNDPNNTGVTGKTTADEVIVYTYEVDINKVYKNNNVDTPLKGAGFKLEKNINGTWTLVKDYTAGEAAKFEFKGLDDGKYRLTETTAPTGYNKLAGPLYFEITADHASQYNEPVVASKKDETFAEAGSLTFNGGNGIYSANVENKAGSTLPSTGGIGTTPFYVGGGILVAAAGIYIIVRKRMKNNENNE